MHKLNWKRINKILSHLGICSRRKTDFTIRDKRILINLLLAEIDMKVAPDMDNIKVNSEELKILKTTSQVNLAYKPRNVITICSDN